MRTKAKPRTRRPAAPPTPPPLHVNTDWFVDKLRQRGTNQRALAKYLDIHPSGVSLMLRGIRQTSAEEAAKLSHFLQQPLGDVMRHLGMDLPPSATEGDVPLIGHVDGHGEVHIGRREGTVPFPPGSPPDTVAIYCRTAMSPRETMDGWTLYFRPVKEVDPNAMGNLVVAKLHNGPVLLRYLRRGYRQGAFNLVSSFDDSIENARLEWASPVMWIRSL